jgi:hypothetical protein
MRFLLLDSRQGGGEQLRVNPLQVSLVKADEAGCTIWLAGAGSGHQVRQKADDVVAMIEKEISSVG